MPIPRASSSAISTGFTPTYSARYNEQVFFDAFSSPDLVNWSKHSRILDTNRVSWARRAMWAPAVVEKGGRYFLFFGATISKATRNAGGSGWLSQIIQPARSRITSANR